MQLLACAAVMFAGAFRSSYAANLRMQILVSYSPVIIGMAYDRWALGRVHRVYLVGAAIRAAALARLRRIAEPRSGFPVTESGPLRAEAPTLLVAPWRSNAPPAPHTRSSRMNTALSSADADRYARILTAARNTRWTVEADVVRGRTFDLALKFLPDSLSLAQDFVTVSDDERRFVSQIQGRTYANVFGLVERFITARMLEVGRDHALDDQNALEAMVRFGDDELRHQAMFREIDRMMAAVLPAGYRFDVDPDAVARVVLAKSTWSVLALTLHIELFVHHHYRQSIAEAQGLSDLFRDVFRFHSLDECQHVQLDEIELRRHDRALTTAQRDSAVDDFIALVGAVDGILQAQARADAGYFAAQCGRGVTAPEVTTLERHFLKAYRWQYIYSGAAHPKFRSIFFGLVTPAQRARVEAALGTLQ